MKQREPPALLPPASSCATRLVACETGRGARAGAITIAQALLMQGRAAAVVAPTRKIPAAGASLKFLDSLFGRDDVPAADVFKNLGPPWQLYVVRHFHLRLS